MKASSFGGLLLALRGFVSALDHASAVGAPCSVRVWVRAPDLEPGQVVQGHVKVELNGACDDIASYSLGLRFAERSWVKTRREGAKLPKRPSEDRPPGLPFPSNDSVYEPGFLGWRGWPDAGANDSVWEKYESDVKDPALWRVREEERIGFETRYTLCDGDGPPSHDLIKPFAILVPSTNYPPAFDPLFRLSFGEETDATDAEHIYAYFLDASFLNGTHREIPAGYTSFNAAGTTQNPMPETVNVTATRSSRCNEGQSCQPEDVTSHDSFTLEITFPLGRYFAQGSVNNITIISHQLGPGLQQASGFRRIHPYVRQQRGWAAKLAADKESAEKLLYTGLLNQPPKLQLGPSLNDDSWILRHISEEHMVFEFPRFTQHRTVRNGTAFATEAVTARFNILHDLYPPFDMYYQTSENVLEVDLEVRNVSCSDAPSPLDEAYGWTPGMEDKNSEILHASIPIFVHRSPEDRARLEAGATSHYLSPAARAPVFVDPSAIMELLGKTVAERDSLAPIAQATFVAHADGDIVKNRYYGREPRGSDSAPYYVGDTWLRKVLARGQSRARVSSPLVIQP